MASVDGVWLEWAGWTDCSLSCAMGWQSRNRTCLGPFYGGDNCTGDISEVQNCMLVECPGKYYSKKCDYLPLLMLLNYLKMTFYYQVVDCFLLKY